MIRALPMRRVASAGLLALLAALSGCAAPQAGAPRPAAAERGPALPATGLDRVLGRDARALAALFGPPDQDQREPGARRLQFASGVCVLDAYLYAKAGQGEPVVTYIDARTPAGDDFDRASCIAALTRRHAAR